MKPLQIEIHELPQAGTIDEQGDFSFYIYASNQCCDEFDEAMETLRLIWELETDVSLKVNMKLKDVYKDLFDMHNARGKIDKEDTPLFESLRKDCQWIIDQINSLEMNA